MRTAGGGLTPRGWCVGVLAGVVLLSGCDTGPPADEDPAPDAPSATAGPDDVGTSSEASRSTDPPPDQAGEVTVEDIAAGVLDVEPPPVIASVEAELETSGGPLTVTLDVLGLATNASSTVLTARLTAPARVTLDTPLSLDGDSQEVSGVALAAGDLTYYPAQYSYGDGVLQQYCVCTQVIRGLGTEGVYVYGSYDALPEDVDSVTVQVPGFPDVEVPVAR